MPRIYGANNSTLIEYWLNSPSGQLRRQHKYKEVQRRNSKQQKSKGRGGGELNLKYFIFISLSMNGDFIMQMDGRKNDEHDVTVLF